MEPFRPTYAEISLTSIRHNICTIKKMLSPQTKFMAIVKANAYGHGSVEVAKAARDAGADYFGVASLGEALELRAASIESPILILSESPHDYIDRLIDANVAQTVYTFELAQLISDIAKQKNKSVKVHIKIDTGMGRVGAKAEEAAMLSKRISTLPFLEVEGVFTHFAKADDRASDFTMNQFDKFMSVVDALRSDGIAVPLIHAANSAAMLNFPKTHLNMVRIGICMYGLMPFENGQPIIDLEPVLSFKSRVLFVKEVTAGVPISYGATFYTRAKTKIATLPVGYADGLSRGLANKGYVIIKNKRYPIVGNVTMDMTMVDVGDSQIGVGDEAVIIGRQLDEMISANELARIDNSINYEVLCGIGKRVPRVYLS